MSEHLELPEFTCVPIGARPAWRHDASGVVFRLIPGGSFRMGLSDDEITTIRAIGDAETEYLTGWTDTWRPVRTVTLPPFLLARHPMTELQVRTFLPKYADPFARDERGDWVAHLTDELDDLLAVLPFRLPGEAEWEYAARAGTTTLSWRGDRQPDEKDLFKRFGDRRRLLDAENPFGLCAMDSANELCADTYFPGYAGAPADGAPRTGDGPRVVRAGGADGSPWQGCGEWLHMLPAATEASIGASRRSDRLSPSRSPTPEMAEDEGRRLRNPGRTAGRAGWGRLAGTSAGMQDISGVPKRGVSCGFQGECRDSGE